LSYTFDALADGASFGAGDTITGTNDFKKTKGLMGSVLQQVAVIDGVPEFQGVPNAEVKLIGPTGRIIETMTDDEDGWYMSKFVPGGKSETYSLELQSGTLPNGHAYGQQTLIVTVGGDIRFAEGNFIVQRLRAWQNHRVAYDVSGDDKVTAIDVLLVVNWLNVYDVGPLPPLPDVDSPWIDVDGNGLATPLDALLVINQINVGVLAGGEGEAAPDTADLPVFEPAPVDASATSIPAIELVPSSGTAAVVTRPATSQDESSRVVSPAGRDQRFAWLGPRDDAWTSLPARASRGASPMAADLALTELDDILPDLAEDVLHGWEGGI